MKILFSILLSLMLVPIITGCNNPATDTNDNNGDKAVTEDTAKDNVDENATNRGEGLKLSFNDFDLDVDYQDTAKNYETEYQTKTDTEAMEAKIQDPKANGVLTGDEAMNKLQPLLEQLKFDKNTADQEVIDEVINVFQLDKDYQKFDLEVVFTDGTKKEYKVQK
ncbi:YusW family protein [Bacillus manliponensis]|uniref:YusW family protein n=1 Tax=Bacillus manliponensis TaxID=574376 RepID=UPI0035197AFB